MKLHEPMAIFTENPKVFKIAEAKRIVHNYNRVQQVLLEYEILYHRAWLTSLEAVEEG